MVRIEVLSAWFPVRKSNLLYLLIFPLKERSGGRDKAGGIEVLRRCCVKTNAETSQMYLNGFFDVN